MRLTMSNLGLYTRCSTRQKGVKRSDVAPSRCQKRPILTLGKIRTETQAPATTQKRRTAILCHCSCLGRYRRAALALSRVPLRLGARGQCVYRDALTSDCGHHPHEDRCRIGLWLPLAPRPGGGTRTSVAPALPALPHKYIQALFLTVPCSLVCPGCHLFCHIPRGPLLFRSLLCVCAP